MQCTQPLHWIPKKNKGKIWDPDLFLQQYPLGYMELPCGKCLACRLRRSKEWSVRLLHELGYWESACFLTFTYRDEDLPPNASLSKAHLQNFFKRLRKLLAVFPIRYYACGEYGDRYGRPHYHVILFGLSETTGQRLAERVWWYGHVDSGTVTGASCRYVAQYIDTKLYGLLAEDVFTSKGRQVPFQLSSQGLGLRFANDHKDRFTKDLHLTVRGIKQGLPRYYQKKLSIDASALAQKSREKLLESVDSALAKGLTTVKEFKELRDSIRTQRGIDLRTKLNLKPRQSKTV